jgi:hypothetical protein
VRALLAGLATATALVVSGAFHLPQPSGANFTARAGTAPASTIAADSAANYLHLYSQGTDPAGLTGYAVKQNSSPPAVAATGSDLGLALQLGGWKNAGTMNRVITLQTDATLPASTITVTTTVPPVPAQPVSSATIAAVGSTGGATSVTLGPSVKRQLNITLSKLPGNNALYNGTIQLRVTWTGYTGTFLTYNVPFTIWDGNGAGP